jgi:hypothetical protein
MALFLAFLFAFASGGYYNVGPGAYVAAPADSTGGMNGD